MILKGKTNCNLLLLVTRLHHVVLQSIGEKVVMTLVVVTLARRLGSREGVRQEVREEVREEVRKEVREGVRVDVREEVRQEVREGVREVLDDQASISPHSHLVTQLSSPLQSLPH